MLSVTDGRGLLASILWNETIYGLFEPAIAHWQLVKSDNGGTEWSEVADLSSIIKPNFYTLQRYNEHLFFPTYEHIYFYDGEEIGNCTTEFDFPGTIEDTLKIPKALKSTNNGLLIAFEDEPSYYQIIQFSREITVDISHELPEIILDITIHETDYFQGEANSLIIEEIDDSSGELIPSFILPFYSSNYSAIGFDIQEYIPD